MGLPVITSEHYWIRSRETEISSHYLEEVPSEKSSFVGKTTNVTEPPKIKGKSLETDGVTWIRTREKYDQEPEVTEEVPHIVAIHYEEYQETLKELIMGLCKEEEDYPFLVRLREKIAEEILEMPPPTNCTAEQILSQLEKDKARLENDRTEAASHNKQLSHSWFETPLSIQEIETILSSDFVQYFAEDDKLAEILLYRTICMPKETSQVWTRPREDKHFDTFYAEISEAFSTLEAATAFLEQQRTHLIGQAEEGRLEDKWTRSRHLTDYERGQKVTGTVYNTLARHVISLNILNQLALARETAVNTGRVREAIHESLTIAEGIIINEYIEFPASEAQDEAVPGQMVCRGEEGRQQWIRVRESVRDTFVQLAAEVNGPGDFTDLVLECVEDIQGIGAEDEVSDETQFNWIRPREKFLGDIVLFQSSAASVGYLDIWEASETDDTRGLNDTVVDESERIRPREYFLEVTEHVGDLSSLDNDQKDAKLSRVPKMTIEKHEYSVDENDTLDILITVDEVVSPDGEIKFARFSEPISPNDEYTIEVTPNPEEGTTEIKLHFNKCNDDNVGNFTCVYKKSDDVEVGLGFVVELNEPQVNELDNKGDDEVKETMQVEEQPQEEDEEIPEDEPEDQEPKIKEDTEEEFDLKDDSQEPEEEEDLKETLENKDDEERKEEMSAPGEEEEVVDDEEAKDKETGDIEEKTEDVADDKLEVKDESEETPADKKEEEKEEEEEEEPVDEKVEDEPNEEPQQVPTEPENSEVKESIEDNFDEDSKEEQQVPDDQEETPDGDNEEPKDDQQVEEELKEEEDNKEEVDLKDEYQEPEEDLKETLETEEDDESKEQMEVPAEESQEDLDDQDDEGVRDDSEDQHEVEEATEDVADDSLEVQEETKDAPEEDQEPVYEPAPQEEQEPEQEPEKEEEPQEPVEESEDMVEEVD